jgi:hypothetical protein
MSAFEQTGDSFLIAKHHAVAQTFHLEQRLPLAKADRPRPVFQNVEHFELRPAQLFYEVPEAPPARVRAVQACFTKALVGRVVRPLLFQLYRAMSKSFRRFASDR